MPLHVLPRDAVPGHLQGGALRFDAWPLSPGFTCPNTGPTSASPGPAPRPWLLRASGSRVASGWRLLRAVTGLAEGDAGFRRSPLSLRASVGRCSPAGFVAVQTGQYRRLPAPYPVSFCFQRVSRLRWFRLHEGSPAPSLALPLDACAAGYPE
jgi:hypothetical protein